MKRYIVWLLTAALLITLVGCTAEPQTGNDSAIPTESAAETTTTTTVTESSKVTETTKATEAVTETTSTTEAPTSEKTTKTTAESTGTTKVTEETGKATEAVTEATSTTEAPTSEKTTKTTTESTGTTTKVTEKTSKKTTTAGLTTDAPLTLTLEKYHGEGYLYKDATVPETNYSLKLTANVDLVNLRLISIDPETATPDASLRTLTPLKKGESQYVLTYVNDANPNRGIVCVDKQGNTYYYAFVYSGNSGRVYLGLLKVTH